MVRLRGLDAPYKSRSDFLMRTPSGGVRGARGGVAVGWRQVRADAPRLRTARRPSTQVDVIPRLNRCVCADLTHPTNTTNPDLMMRRPLVTFVVRARVSRSPG